MLNNKILGVIVLIFAVAAIFGVLFYNNQNVKTSNTNNITNTINTTNVTNTTNTTHFTSNSLFSVLSTNSHLLTLIKLFYHLTALYVYNCTIRVCFLKE